MNWRDRLIDAMKNGTVAELAAQARLEKQTTYERFDFKKVQAEGRQPGEDEQEAA